ncbi:MAG: mannose-1-phosphate guanylyltransferase/mannose-6-phosphate isomerase [Alphaproteobacteria bacterium]|nr:mannose-1-phosphate guanylyltransferase/mannose-6-phosphate isomerase [Alphaproteobacteria bacterium]
MPSAYSIIPVILCGGSGSRLWPLSREQSPKQFLKLLGSDQSLLTQTATRALACSGASASQLVSVTLDSLKKKTILDLASLHPDAANHVLGEPCARNTAAAIAYAALYVAEHFGRDSVIWVLPADHYISDEHALKKALDTAARAASEGKLVTFGMTPTRPETGYGYIQCQPQGNGRPAPVLSFVEKPDAITAQAYFESGKYLWNSGMFVFSAGKILESYGQYAKNLFENVKDAVQYKTGMKSLSPDKYQNLPPIPFDTAIMEKTDQAVVIPCQMGWSDIGSWESVWEMGIPDSEGNIHEGKVTSVETSNSFIRAGSLRIATAGLQDVVIIEDGDSLLVADKKNAGAMRMLMDTLKKMNIPETVEPNREERPWGQFRVLSRGTGYKVKEIIVKPGQKLSLQMHHHRCEFWTVISGEAWVEIDRTIKNLKAQENIFIPLHAHHRLENPGQQDLVMIEVQCGDYLGEDDIVRFDDIYGRMAV